MEYRINPSGKILIPKISKYSFLIDDGGDVEAGYTAFVGFILDDIAKEELKKRIASISATNDGTPLHATKMSARNYKKYERIYLRVFETIVDVFASSLFRFCWMRFANINEAKQNTSQLRTNVSEIMQGAGLTQDAVNDLGEATAYILLPLMQIASVVNISQTGDTEISLLVDQKQNYRDISNKKYLVGSSAPVPQYGSSVQTDLINTYLDVVGGFKFKFNSMELADSKRTTEIQAVDSVANFAWNWIKTVVPGNTRVSEVTRVKAGMFVDFLRKANMTQSDLRDMESILAKDFEFTGNILTAKTKKPVWMMKIG